MMKYKVYCAVRVITGSCEKKKKDSNILLNHLLIPNPDMCAFQLPSNDYLALIGCAYPDYCYNLAYVAHFIAYHT